MSIGEAAGGVEALLAQVAWARRLASGLLGDRADADDLVQEALLVGVQRPPAGGGAIRGWFATVLRNLAVNRAVADRRRRSREGNVEAEVTANPEDALAIVQSHRLLARMLEEMPEDLRRLLVLRYFEERSSAEIGALLDMPPATVRWRLSLALDELRGRLDAEHSGDRRRWRLALVPLASQAPSGGKGAGRTGDTGRSLALPSVVTLATVVVVVVLVAASGRRPPSTADVEKATASRGPLYAAPLPTMVSATGTSAAPGTDGALGVSSCSKRLLQAERELESLNQDIRRFEDPEAYWSTAAASTQAQAAVEPLIADFVAERAATLECREWICRITFVRRPDADWMAERAAALEGSWRQRAGALVDRAEFDKLGGITRDPLSGELQQIAALFLWLQRAFGEEASPGRMSHLSTATCSQRLATVRAQADSLRPRRDRALPMAERFQRTPSVDRAASSDVKAAIDKALGGLAGAVNIECRGVLCRADLVATADAGMLKWGDVDARLRRDAGWSARFPALWAGSNQERYLKLNPSRHENTPEEARLEAVHKELSTKIFAVVRSCVADNPGGALVNGRVLVPGPGELNEDGRDDGASFRLSGPGAEGPLGRCVRPQLSRVLAEVALPVPLSAWELNFSFNGQSKKPASP